MSLIGLVARHPEFIVSGIQPMCGTVCPSTQSEHCLYNSMYGKYYIHTSYILNFNILASPDGAQPSGYILFHSSTKLSIKFVQLINDKMPTTFGILTFISMMNTTPESLKARQIFSI